MCVRARVRVHFCIVCSALMHVTGLVLILRYCVEGFKSGLACSTLQSEYSVANAQFIFTECDHIDG